MTKLTLVYKLVGGLTVKNNFFLTYTINFPLLFLRTQIITSTKVITMTITTTRTPITAPIMIGKEDNGSAAVCCVRVCGCVRVCVGVCMCVHVCVWVAKLF